jgi:hypothetical protein
MRHISFISIRMFVAGAIALDGLHTILRSPRYFAAPNVGVIVSFIIGALGLPLAVGVFMGSTLAFRVMHIYLWVAVVAGCVVLAATAWALRAGALHNSFVLSYSQALFVYAILLGLVLWSISKEARGIAHT